MKKLILILILSPILIFSQNDTNRISFGLFAGYGLNFHSGDFKQLPSCPSCSPGFTTGTGSGILAGLIFDLPVYKQFILSNKLFYRDISATLEKDEKTTVFVNTVKQEGEFRHTLETTINVIGIEPALKYPIFENLFINLGLSLSYMLTKDYSHIERITKPENYGTFIDEYGNDTYSRERHKFSGSFDDSMAQSEKNDLYFAPMLSVSYKLPLNTAGNLFFEPELAYNLGINDLITHNLVNKWKVSTLSFIASIKYSPSAKPEIIEEHKRFEQIDTVYIESEIYATKLFKIGRVTTKSNVEKNENVILTTEILTRTDTLFTPKQFALSGSISAVGVDENGKEIPNPIFKIEEFVYNRLDPLLNYIFFDDNSSEIPNRYKLINGKEAGKFNLDSLYQVPTMEIYYNILNIIGERMKKYPKANITLIGCNSDFGAEKGNIALSQQRANNVKDYLVNIWQIEEKRIGMKAQNLPDKASTPINEKDKIEENRRVEIISNDFTITEPVFIENIQRTSNPPIARFYNTFKTEAGVEEWEIVAYQNSEATDTFKVNGINDPPDKYDWKIDENQLYVPKFMLPVNFQLLLTDKKGQISKSNEKQFDAEIITISEKRKQKIEDFEIEKYSLILFDFDKSNIENSNREIVKIINQKIKPKSVIEIKGYTDRTGDPAHNLKLSEERANSTKAAIGREDAKANGIGMQQLLYDNNFPEGRFYCRTVEVIVKTKMVK